MIEAPPKRGRGRPPKGSPAAHSGTISLRMPRSLHRQLPQLAAADGNSLNQYIVITLDRGSLGVASDLNSRAVDRLELGAAHRAEP